MFTTATYCMTAEGVLSHYSIQSRHHTTGRQLPARITHDSLPKAGRATTASFPGIPSAYARMAGCALHVQTRWVQSYACGRL
jgi:hypothetical protein